MDTDQALAGEVEGERPIGRLEAEICSMAAQLAATTCAWLELLAEFDRRKGWAVWGIKSCAHWLSWRCSMAPGAAREHLRVARALADLPLVRARFAEGRLSYSKARALTRVATADNEAELVKLGLGMTGAQLERVVRAYRSVTGTTLTQFSRRRVTYRWEEDGMFTARIRLMPEEGARFLAATRAAKAASIQPAAPTDPSGDGDVPAETSGGCEVPADTPGVSDADAVVMVLDGFLAAAPDDGSGDDRTLVVLHADVSLVTETTDAESAPTPPPLSAVPSRGDGEYSPIAAVPGAGPRCHLEEGPGLESATVHRALCTAAVLVMLHRPDGSVLDVGRATRRLTRALRRALRARDGGCRYPGCTRRRYLHAHHIQSWLSGGRTDLDNLVLLCPAHHMLIHEVGFGLAVDDTGRLQFYRPDGKPLPDQVGLDPSRSPVGTVWAADRAAAPAGAKVPFRPDALRPLWGGESFELDYVIANLVQPNRPHAA